LGRKQKKRPDVFLGGIDSWSRITRGTNGGRQRKRLDGIFGPPNKNEKKGRPHEGMNARKGNPRAGKDA